MDVKAKIDFAAGEVSALETAAEVVTSNNTVTTLTTIDLSMNARGYLRVKMIAVNVSDQTKGLSGGRFCHFKCDMGTASALSVVNDPSDYLNGFTTATWTIDASGQTLRIRVTGETGQTINWYCIYEFQEFSDFQL